MRRSSCVMYCVIYCVIYDSIGVIYHLQSRIIVSDIGSSRVEGVVTSIWPFMWRKRNKIIEPNK